MEDGPFKQSLEQDMDGVIRQELITYKIEDGVLKRQIVTRDFIDSLLISCILFMILFLSFVRKLGYCEEVIFF